MKSFIFALLLLFCSDCFAQLSIDVRKAEAISGLKSPRVIGDLVFYSADSKPVATEYAVFAVEHPEGVTFWVDVERLINFQGIDLVAGDHPSTFDAATNRYYFSGKGKYRITLSAIVENQRLKESKEILLGGVEPAPPIDPDVPDVPIVVPDGYKGITKATYELASKLDAATAAKIAANYAVVINEAKSNSAKYQDGFAMLTTLSGLNKNLNYDAKWSTQFFVPLGNLLNKTAGQDGITTAEGIKVFEAIRDGLQLVK